MISSSGMTRTPLPKGFTANGLNCGVRKIRPDLGVILSDRDAVGVGVYTQSECKAAPILYSMGVTPSEKIRAILTNSGQANAATGEQGVANNLKMIGATAHALKCNPDQVLVASTGVIGNQLEIGKIVDAIPALVERTTEIADVFALSILTTDLVPKTISTQVSLSEGNVRITGICKGSGMIHPNMATMLGYILTDAKLTLKDADALLKESNAVSFNMISVDGDTSTNDCVFFLANGATNVEPKTEDDWKKFRKAITVIAQSLAKSIARDGEGADKLLEVSVKGSPDQETAVIAARGVTRSPLFKAAVHGGDPNWGRILARLGADQVPAACLNKMNLEIQGTRIFTNGAPVEFDRPDVRTKMKADTVKIEIDLKSGKYEATAWGCDLSKRYVEINVDYN